MAHNYTLRVTAGSEYDPDSHKIVPVNTSAPVSIQSDLIDVDLNVRIQVRLAFLLFYSNSSINPLNIYTGNTRC
jgi:hypothetical protein